MSETMEIVISYEDRLRLSELAGKLTDAQWIVDNPLIVNIVPCILLVIVAVIIAGVLHATLLDDLKWEWETGLDRTPKKYKVGYKLICCAIYSLPIILPIMLFFIIHAYQVHDVEVIQAEIDEIYRIWGLKEGY